METSNSILGDSFLGSKWLNPDYLFSRGVEFFHQLFNYSISPETLSVFHTALFLIALFFLTLISYCSIRLLEIRHKEHKHLKHEIAEYAHHLAEREKKKRDGEGKSKNEKWVKTLEYLFSPHASDWKLAVIEADTMLETLIGELGFQGKNLGERLKAATQETFSNLSLAWEVHSIRNRIAHEGTSFDLSHHEAKRVIAIYEQIFREFGYI